jgi:hypothetical protein
MRRRPAQEQSVGKRIRKVALWFGVIVGLWMIVVILGQIKSSQLLGKKWRTAIVFRTNPVVVVSFKYQTPDEDMAITLPSAVLAHVPFGYGPYRLESVWRLGELEKRPSLFASTVADLLGIPMQGWVGSASIDDLNDVSKGSILNQLKRRYSLVKLLFGQVSTELNYLDRLIIGWRLARMGAQSVRIFETHENPALFFDSHLPDGSAVKEVNEDALSLFLEQRFEDTQVRGEGVRIKVYNTTQTAGIGQRFARYISNFGGKVIGVANNSLEIKGCLIRLQKAQQSAKIVAFLERTFACTIQIREESLEADIEVYTGMDFGKRWKN